MKFTPIMTPEMISSLTSMVDGKTIDSRWYAILVKAIFVISLLISASMYQFNLKMVYPKHFSSLVE